VAKEKIPQVKLYMVPPLVAWSMGRMVLRPAPKATAFYGKSHLGDIEASYMTNQGFDEALWTPYNQVASLYTPQAEHAGAIGQGALHPEAFPKDPYDMDDGWRPKGYVWALEGKKGGPVREWGTPPRT
jgi:arylsulfatase